MLEENELLDNTRIRGADAPQPKHGRLAKPEKKSLRRLFNQLDVDRNGTLDEHELVSLAAAGGKKLSRRQLAEAMAEMDADGSGSVEYEEFEKWWEHGAQHPPQGTDVFRRITAQLETKFSNLGGSSGNLTRTTTAPIHITSSARAWNWQVFHWKTKNSRTS